MPPGQSGSECAIKHLRGPQVRALHEIRILIQRPSRAGANAITKRGTYHGKETEQAHRKKEDAPD